MPITRNHPRHPGYMPLSESQQRAYRMRDGMMIRKWPKVRGKAAVKAAKRARQKKAQ